MVDRFFDALAKSTVTTFCISMTVVGTFCYLCATHSEIPEVLKGTLWTCMGFFFGMKGHLESIKHFRARAEKAEAQLSAQ